MGENLSDKISLLLNSAPTTYDPEDEGNEDSAARIEYNVEDDQSDDDLNLSQFRKQNVELLEDVDQRYTGTRVSRQSLKEDGSDYEAIDEAEDDEDDETSDEGTNEEEESEDYAENDYDSDNDVENDYDSDNDAEDDRTKLFTDSSTTAMLQQSNKSSCVRQQLSLWENFLEMRIQMQKCLLTSNKFPQSKNFKNLQINSTEFCDGLTETTLNVQNLLDKFLHLQHLLLRRYPETKNILNKSEDETHIQSDEEIPSETDGEVSIHSNDESDIPHKRMKLGEYKNELSRRFKSYNNYRNSVLQKWQDKTRITSNKSENIHSITQQINHVLSNKDKLVKATQLKRTDYNIIGEDINNTDQSSEVFNSDIFDDTDFYQHLLRELIEFKSADVTDPIKLSRQWIQLQRLRSKMKKKVDTKATKGRKIRYVVHPKLVNFMAPVEDSIWQESAKDELYSSLFGKNRLST